MSAAAEFLLNPGLPGACAALMDEYARAAADLCVVVERIEPVRYSEERPSPDRHTASLHAVCRHVIGAAMRYADYIRAARSLPYNDPPYEVPASAIATPAEFRAPLIAALRYTEGALEGLYGASEDELAAIRFTVRWGPTYDPDMLLEHAIVHLLRHRRQIERWA